MTDPSEGRGAGNDGIGDQVAQGPGVGIADIETARRAVERVAQRTPVFSSRYLSEHCGARVVLKAESLQRTGSFKIRGATAKLEALGERAARGIVVGSAGNHAQAAAYAARAAGVPCEVYMPVDASIAKSEATVSYGATVHLLGTSVDESLALAMARAEAAGLAFVHPFDDPAVVAGQGTLGLELLEEIPDLARVIVPLGGGGLASGVAIAVKSAARSGVEVIGVQAAACAPFPSSVAAGKPMTCEEAVPTLADGIAVKRPGELTVSLVSRFVDDIVVVGEDEIADAMILLLERSKLVVEGAGAVGVAALLGGQARPSPSGTTVAVLSGGNVDSGLLTAAIRRHETNAGRRIVLLAKVPDRPGKLAELLSRVGSTGANLVTVEHLREGLELHVRETAVHLVLETRNAEHAGAVLNALHEAGYEVEAVGRARPARLDDRRQATSIALRAVSTRPAGGGAAASLLVPSRPCCGRH